MMRTVMWILVLSCAGTCFAAPEFHYLSYLGGDGDDGLSRVHLDGAGFLVAIATSSSDLVTTAGAFMPSPVPETPTSSDVYLASFAPDHRLLAATFLGAPLSDRPLLLTRLPGGDVLLVMNSTMESLPVDMHHMLDDSYHHDSNEDLLIVRMLPDLTAPRWTARVEGGSSGADLSAGVVDGDRLLLSWAAAWWSSDATIPPTLHRTILHLDDGRLLGDTVEDGCATVALASRHDGGTLLLRQTRGTLTMPDDAYQTTPAGALDMVLTLADADMQPLASTYFGGSDDDAGEAAVVLPDGSIVICARSWSDDLPVVGVDWSHGAAGGGDTDLHLSRWSADLSRILWAGYLGGSGFEEFADLALDDAGHLVVLGWTASPDFPVTPDAPVTTHDQEFGQGFLTRLDAVTGAMDAWSTFLVAGTWARPFDLSLASGRMLIGGGCRAPLPLTPDAYDAVPEGTEAFLLLATDDALVPLEPTQPPRLLPGGLSLDVMGRNRATIALRAGLPEPAHADVAVHDLRGRRIASLHVGALPAGFTDLEWDGRTAGGRKAPRGAYCVSLSAQGRRTSRTITLR
ncbi:MAG TPA: FlgD immunoglobulin-like domain containing protein [Candidatus Krumholzibacteria bacterium]|nr:FlgD immunoglobulin-like domain containing protein [Candidatus Krumholzibacteria bacterium]